MAGPFDDYDSCKGLKVEFVCQKKRKRVRNAQLVKWLCCHFDLKVGKNAEKQKESGEFVTVYLASARTYNGSSILTGEKKKKRRIGRTGSFFFFL